MGLRVRVNRPSYALLRQSIHTNFNVETKTGQGFKKYTGILYN